VRNDIAVLVSAWDKKTAKKAKGMEEVLANLGVILGSEVPLAVEPCVTYYPGTGRPGMWGFLCLTKSRLLFEGMNGSSRLELAEIDELNIRSGGGDSFIASMMVGGMIEVRVGSEWSHLELQTTPATQRIWRPLQDEWTRAKAARRQRSASSASAREASIADELNKLAALRSQGVLTEDEFAAQKQRLLSG
jgi:Short C-terminal domain